MIVQSIALSFGYAEESALSWVFFRPYETEFDSAAAAVEDLAMDLLRVFEPSLFQEDPRKDCCQATLDKMPKARLCATCGTWLEEREWDLEQFEEWLRVLTDQTTNSIYSDFDAVPMGWDPWGGPPVGAPAEEVIVIEEAAERQILKALDPDKVPEPCGKALREWWVWVSKGGKTRQEYLQEWNEGTFEW